MRAVVTGGAGFIGSHLADELIARGAEVHIIDNRAAGDSAFVHPSAEIHAEDIRSEKVKEIFQGIRPDTVFHLAAQVDVRRSVKSPRQDADINLAGTLNVLEAAKTAGVKKIIFSSTSAVYGEKKDGKICETSPPDPVSFYGLSKWAGEKYIELFSRIHHLPFTILRYGNVYGPRQRGEGEAGVIAVFLEKLSRKEPFTVYGDGEQTRDFIYVSDVVEATIAAADKGDGEIIHVSTGKKTSLNTLIRTLERIHGTALKVNYQAEKPGDIKESCLDNEKAKRILGFQPKVSLMEGLKITYQWKMGMEKGHDRRRS
ncbi:NAD-dependent epimerase/dehydratase family protein [Caldibacillus debilis]|uniref:NAD-dependent epimerase/dehydratase family protein n=1 Tax=Caldibacillus debilis TaxID=301148 RepID=UPI000E3A4B75|nr:NAD-dependent epimerase/dehydratase family protein [Caldibacillus debilis]MBY6272624.1 UDP-glucose 4-epimerase [Bacillaceae bacterium]REJ27966.1 MAG: UDP-glucose 4-epimerase [Caldibacillus debilis]